MESKRTNTAAWVESRQRWQINVRKDGQRRTFVSATPGRKGQREANAKADAWLEGQRMDGSAKVSVVYPLWIDSLKDVTSRDHWKQYESIGRNDILPLIGTVKLSALTQSHLESVTKAAYKRGLAHKTLTNINGCMRAFVSWARQEKYTTLVVDKIRIPRDAPRTEHDILKPDDLAVLFSVSTTLDHGRTVQDDTIHAYRFSVVTGLRPSELVGLQWGDIAGDVLQVKRSITVHGEVRNGKTENALRAFVLTPLAKKILSDQRELQDAKQNPSPYIFAFPGTESLKEQTYYKRWCHYRDTNGLTAGVTPYELRHTFVSIAHNLPAGALRGLVGHSESMDSLGTYDHSKAAEDHLAADMISDLFTEILGR